MPDLNLDALERLAKAATSGPWEWSASMAQWRVTSTTANGAPGTLKTICTKGINRQSPPNIDPDNMAFIAAANPATVLALIERVRELEQFIHDTERGRRRNTDASF